EVGPLTPAKAARLGVIRTFQNLKVLPRLTVLENVAIGAGRSRTAGLPATLVGTPPARRLRRDARRAAEWALDFVQIGASPAARRPTCCPTPGSSRSTWAGVIMLELRGVTARYGSVEAIRDVSLTVPEGTTVALLGRNGAGKTTTLRVVSGVVRPVRGEVLFAGERLDGRR